MWHKLQVATPPLVLGGGVVGCDLRNDCEVFCAARFPKTADEHGEREPTQWGLALWVGCLRPPASQGDLKGVGWGQDLASLQDQQGENLTLTQLSHITLKTPFRKNITFYVGGRNQPPLFTTRGVTNCDLCHTHTRAHTRSPTHIQEHIPFPNAKFACNGKRCAERFGRERRTNCLQIGDTLMDVKLCVLCP